jgi:hypothetical protein
MNTAMSKEVGKSKAHRPATDKSALTIPHAGLPGEATPLGWVAPRQQLTFDEWVGAGKVLGRATSSLHWLLGDWWCYGRFDYGDRCKALASSGIGLSLQTLSNYGSVSRAFATCSRRREALSWTHHAEVCTLAAREADALLDRAEREKLSTHALRLLVADRHAEEFAAREAMMNEPPYGAEDIDTAPPVPSLPPLPPAPQQRLTNEPLLRLNTAVAMLNDLLRVPPEKLVAVHASPPHLRVLAMFFDNIAAAKEGKPAKALPGADADEGEATTRSK